MRGRMAGMDTVKQSKMPAIAIGLALIGLSLFYTVAYSALSHASVPVNVTAVRGVRLYRHKWQAKLFAPAAKIESALRQKEISTGWISDVLPLRSGETTGPGRVIP